MTFERKFLNFKNAAVLISLLLLAFMLLVPPSVGVSDDGNLFSTAQSSGIYGDISASNATFSFEKENNAIAKNNTVVLGLSLLKNITGGVNTHVIAGIFSILFLLCLYFSLRTAKTDDWWMNLIIAVLAVLIFVDQGYVGYFNSIHKEAFIFISMIGIFTAGFLTTREKTSFWPILFYGLSAAAFVFISPEYCVMGILLSLFAFRMVAFKKRRLHKLVALLMGICIIITAILTPKWEVATQREMNLYHAVFYGISMTSNHFEQDLKQLGLNPAVLKGLSKTSYFDKNIGGMTDEMLQQEFYQKISYRKIAGFYMKHPARLVRLLSRGANNATIIKIGYLGNYENAAGKEDGAVSHFFTGYSTVKPKIIPGLLSMHLIFFCVYLAVLIIMRRQKQGSKTKHMFYEFIVALILCTICAMTTTVICHGLANIAKAMYLYNLLFDLLLITAIVGGIRILYQRRKKLQKEFGVTQ